MIRLYPKVPVRVGKKFWKPGDIVRSNDEIHVEGGNTPADPVIPMYAIATREQISQFSRMIAG